MILALPLSAWSQTGQVVHRITGNSGNFSLELKWYTQSLVYKNGVNVYKRILPSTKWVKLNALPIKRGKPISPNALANDSALAQSYTFVKDLREDQFTGIMLLNTLLQSFNSISFSEYLGVYLKDENLSIGTKVKYKVNSITNGGSEKLLIESDTISIAKPKTLFPPKEIAIIQKKKIVKFKWQPEPQLYYGVNIYRKKAEETQFVKITDYPILISETGEKNEMPEIFYEDVDLEESNTYDYVLKAINFFGEESQASRVFTASIKDLTPPVRPNDLHKVDVRLNEVSIAWKNAKYEDEVTLSVYRSLKYDSLYQKVNTTPLANTDTMFVEEVQEGMGYYYYVASVDSSGNESHSNIVFIEVEDMVAPAIPTGIVAESDTGKIRITWSANSEKDLWGYRIYRTVNKDKETDFVLITPDPLKENEFIDELPKNAKNYFLYKIAAIDTSYNMSGLSAPVKLKMPDVTPPAQAFIKIIIQKEGALLVQWIANVETDLAGYQLYRRSEMIPEWETVNVNVIPPTRAQFSDRNIDEGVLYEYYLVAIDSTGNISPKSKLFPFKSEKSEDLKLEPTLSLKYKERANKVQLLWKHEPIEGDELKGYAVFRKRSNEQYKKITALMEGRLFNDKDLKKGDYSYQIRIYLTSGKVVRTKDAQVAIN